MKNKCAWCKVDTDTQPKFTADSSEEGCCSVCGCYNDIGQRTIEINSMKQIYRGAISLLGYMVEKISYAVDYAGLMDDLKESLDVQAEEDFIFAIEPEQVVKKLFLQNTHNSGGTSTGNLMKRLGLDDEPIEFVFDYGKESEDE